MRARAIDVHLPARVVELCESPVKRIPRARPAFAGKVRVAVPLPAHALVDSRVLADDVAEALYLDRIGPRLVERPTRQVLAQIRVSRHDPFG